MNNIEQLKANFDSTRLDAKEAYRKFAINDLIGSIEEAERLCEEYRVSWQKHMDASMLLFLAECENQ